MADDNDTKEPELNANNDTTTVAVAVAVAAGMGRKEKRKLLKKLKRKQLRRDAAIKERENEEAELNDPEVQSRLLRLEKEEAERMERDRLEFEERERLFVLELELKKKRRQEEEEAAEKEEEEARKKRDLVSDGDENDLNESNDWEYVEEGPAEIIWKGNEIIVKKKKVKVLKKAPDLQIEKQESERPISNPLAPQSEAFKDYRTAQEVLDSVAQQVPNFGTEKDKAHCPFHLKTGACRFGPRCSRAHFYPDKSCTLLIKNMYSGPGLAWEQDEGLEYTDDEAERSFEEFYEDVHTEFLKFGEIVNFKVCKNASSHLRGNVYVHFKLLESAVLAYQSINGRYFAGKQLSCEFVNLTKWRIAICGEYMKSGLKTCSRGSVCNFIHCFRNPGGDYEWADWDKPAPRYWVKEMAALFGCTSDRCKDESLRYRSNSSRSRGPDSPHRKSHFDENDTHKSKYLQRNRGDYEENTSSAENYRIKRRRTDIVSKSDDDREEHNSRSRGPDSPHRKSHFDENDSHKSKYLQRNRGDYEDKTSSAENYRIKRWRTDSVSKSDDDSEERNSRPRTSNLKKESDTKLTGQVSRKREERRGKKEEYSSDIDSIGDSLLRDKRLCIKDDRYLSDSNSNGRRLGRDRRSQKNTKRTSTSKDKSEHRELQKSDTSLERDDDNCRYHGANSSRASKSNSKAVLNGVRTETDEKRHQKDRGKSRSDNQGDFIDSETERFHDRSDGRRHRSTKNHKRVKHEAETSDDASDGGTSRRYKKERRKDKRTSSRSKKHGLDSLDVPSNVRSLNREDRHDGYGKRNKSNEETAVSQTVKVLLDDKVDADLEETYRNAALKKLEEMKKCKEPLHIQCKKQNTSDEIDSHEDIAVKDAGGCKYLEELSTSREAETSTASARRKRI